MSESSRERPTSAPAPRPAADPVWDVVPLAAGGAELRSPTGPPPAWRIETWSLDRLVDHPQQAALFHDLDGPEFDEFVANLEREGIRDPIEVTPYGVTIDGHQRRRAARRLGLSEVPVRVRYDLAGDEAGIDRAHLEANRNRRQLGPLDQVRIARRLAEIEAGRPPGQIAARELKALCGRVGERMGLSPRHAQRLLNISGLPMLIQKAFSEGRLKLVDADRISRLARRTQEGIAAEIEAGGDPARVVAPYLERPARKAKPGDAFERLVDELARALDALEGREGEIPRPVSRIRADLEVLERFQVFSEVVVPILEKRFEASERAWDEILADYEDEDTTDDVDSDIA